MGALGTTPPSAHGAGITATDGEQEQEDEEQKRSGPCSVFSAKQNQKGAHAHLHAIATLRSQQIH